MPNFTGRTCHASKAGGSLGAKITHMYRYRLWQVPAILVTMVIIGGCGTINFFPQKAAEKAADQVLDQITAARPKPAPAEPPPANAAPEVAEKRPDKSP